MNVCHDDRPYFHCKINELEQEIEANWWDHFVLSEVSAELRFRKQTNRVKQLERRIESVSDE